MKVLTALKSSQENKRKRQQSEKHHLTGDTVHTCDVTCIARQGRTSREEKKKKKKKTRVSLVSRFYLTGRDDANRSVLISLSLSLSLSLPLPPSLSVTSWYWAAFCWNHRNATHFVFTAQSYNTLISSRVLCRLLLRLRVPCSQEDVTTLPTVWTPLNLFAETTLWLQESVGFFFSSSSSSAAFPTWDQVDSVCVFLLLARRGNLGREVSTPDMVLIRRVVCVCVFFFFKLVRKVNTTCGVAAALLGPSES